MCRQTRTLLQGVGVDVEAAALPFQVTMGDFVEMGVIVRSGEAAYTYVVISESETWESAELVEWEPLPPSGHPYVDDVIAGRAFLLGLLPSGAV